MHFNQARQGKGPLGPRRVRPAFVLIGAGIAYSQLFYPSVRAVETAIPPTAEIVPEISRKTHRPEQRITKVTLKDDSTLRVVMQMEEIPDASLAADLCRRILRAQEMTLAARQKKESQK